MEAPIIRLITVHLLVLSLTKHERVLIYMKTKGILTVIPNAFIKL